MDYEIMMNGIVKIGDRAPEIEATTTMGKFNLNDYKGKWVVLFSHPGDFTPVKSESWGEYMKTPDIADKNRCLIVSLKWNKNATKSIVRRLIRKIIINWKKKILNI